MKILLFRDLGGNLCLGFAWIFGVWLLTLPAFVKLPWVGIYPTPSPSLIVPPELKTLPACAVDDVRVAFRRDTHLNARVERTMDTATSDEVRDHERVAQVFDLSSSSASCIFLVDWDDSIETLAGCCAFMKGL